MNAKFLVFILNLPLIFSECSIAVANQVEDLSGIWKTSCEKNWGLQIARVNSNLYSITFCGNGTCKTPGTWAPDSPIFGDPTYEVIDGTKIKLHNRNGTIGDWHKCSLGATDSPFPSMASNSETGGSNPGAPTAIKIAAQDTGSGAARARGKAVAQKSAPSLVGVWVCHSQAEGNSLIWTDHITFNPDGSFSFESTAPPPNNTAWRQSGSAIEIDNLHVPGTARGTISDSTHASWTLVDNPSVTYTCERAETPATTAQSNDQKKPTDGVQVTKQKGTGIASDGKGSGRINIVDFVVTPTTIPPGGTAHASFRVVGSNDEISWSFICGSLPGMDVVATNSTRPVKVGKEGIRATQESVPSGTEVLLTLRRDPTSRFEQGTAICTISAKLYDGRQLVTDKKEARLQFEAQRR